MRFLLLVVLLTLTVPALAYDWDYLSMDGVWSTSIVNDPVHERVFVGTVEGRDVFSGEVDVIVCDGFTGNVILKVAEGLGEMVIGTLKEEARRSPVYGAGLLMAKGAFRNLKRKVDYSEYGGAPLLGINGACLIGHGRSNVKALRNAVRFAHSYASSGVIRRIGQKILEVLEIPTERGRS